jgi:ParB family transcriptional regulator, chromosome partitioning protein
MFSVGQLRVFLRALVNLDPYTLTEDVAEHFAGDNENNQQTADDILLSTLDGLTDGKLTGFALRLALTGHIDIPREGELDFLTEAEAIFASPQPMKEKKARKAPTSIKAAAKKSTAKKKVAA